MNATWWKWYALYAISIIAGMVAAMRYGSLLFAMTAMCVAVASRFAMWRDDERRNTRMLTLIIAFLLFASTAHAHGYCYTPSYQREVVYQQPQTIIEHQQVFYSVGADVRQYATAPAAIAQAQAGQVERQIARLQDQLAEYKAQAAPVQPQMVYCLPVQAAYCPPGQQPAQQPAQQVPPQQQPPAQSPTFSERAPQSILQAACLKCHSGASAKGGFDLTGELTCEQKQTAIGKVALGDMPKGGPKLSPQQFTQFMKEIAALKTAGPPAADPQPAQD